VSRKKTHAHSCPLAVPSSSIKKLCALKIEELPEFDGHELVLYLYDKTTGLRGFIAIHNTNAGPAVGGTRFCHYESEEDALRDALRLSRAMTYKCALANVSYGGGKAVLMAPRSARAAEKLKNEKYLAAYTRRMNLLDGHFFTGEDVGITKCDIKILARHSSSIIGRPSVGELPSHWAAVSVYESMRAALVTMYDNDSFKNRTVAIKGLGNVGLDLAKMLSRAGAYIIGAEINQERVQRARKHVKGIHIVSSEVIHKQKADIFSPCALSGDLSKKTIPQVRTKIICGAANNQLATAEDGMRLFKYGIIYIPDYIANGGGLINVIDELHSGGYNRERVERNVARVRTTVARLLAESKKQRRPPDQIADEIARSRFRIMES
jgi:leucine dehydrogenase